MNTKASLLTEIFQEVDNAQKHRNAIYANTSSSRKTTLKEVQKLNWRLTKEEEFELSNAFEKIKGFAKRAYSRAKPVIITADIVRRLFFPSTDPVAVQKDIARYTEQYKKDRDKDNIEAAQVGPNKSFKQRPPDKEMPLVFEIFMEAENELDKELELEFYEAILVNGNYTKGKRIPKNKAIEIVRKGGNVITDSKSEADLLAKHSFRGKPMRHGKGHPLPGGRTGLPHVHPRQHVNSSHIFYPAKKVKQEYFI